MSKPKLFCPFRKGDCVEEKCALWIVMEDVLNDSGRCSFRQMAFDLLNIRSK